MGRNNMELGRWRDGSVCLTFWDHFYGNDKVFILKKDGQALLQEDDGDTVSYKLVNLVEELRALMESIENTIETEGQALINQLLGSEHD